MQKLKKTTSNAESESLVEIIIYRVNNFLHLLREKATESSTNNNSKNNSNTAIRKQFPLGTAAMTVIQIFHNLFQLSTPTIRKWARGLLRNNSNKKVALNNHYHQESIITRRLQISKIIKVSQPTSMSRSNDRWWL